MTERFACASCGWASHEVSSGNYCILCSNLFWQFSVEAPHTHGGVWWQMGQAVSHGMLLSWYLLCIVKVSTYIQQMTTIFCYIPVESLKPSFLFSRRGANLLSGFPIHTLLSSIASSTPRTPDVIAKCSGGSAGSLAKGELVCRRVEWVYLGRNIHPVYGSRIQHQQSHTIFNTALNK